ncbi:MAG: peptidylprolyl isomerase, partial [Bacteroidales bacterium]|nr:peptidylprolyl isomerase [Bacteroidales bacterium]
MKIGKNAVVEVSYDLEVEGQLVDRATREHPLDYIQGTNMLIPKFEAEVEGLEPGEEFSFTVTPEEGYGEYDLAKVKELPKDAFKIDGKVREDLLTIGRQIPMYNSTGHVEVGTVIAVTEDKVTMDFNHIMAGKTLLFKGTVVSVREATEKELKEGLH